MAEPAAPSSPAPKGPAGRKVGPFTTVQWVIIGVGAGVVWYLLSRRKAAQTAAATADPGATLTGAGSPNPVNALGGAMGGGLGGLQGAFTDNQSWYQAAFNALVASGYDPAQVVVALSHYLSGDTLSAAEQAMLSLALGRVGTPPNPPTFSLGGTGGPVMTPGGGGTGAPILSGRGLKVGDTAPPAYPGQPAPTVTGVSTDPTGGVTTLFSGPTSVNSYTPPASNLIPAYVGAPEGDTVNVGSYTPTLGGMVKTPTGQTMYLAPGALASPIFANAGLVPA